jgi:hypothetical protein
MPFFSRIAELVIDARVLWLFVDFDAIDAILSFSGLADVRASAQMIDGPRLATNKVPNVGLDVFGEDWPKGDVRSLSENPITRGNNRRQHYACPAFVLKIYVRRSGLTMCPTISVQRSTLREQARQRERTRKRMVRYSLMV